MSSKLDIVFSIEREGKVCDFVHHELKNRCNVFEEKYKLSSDEFYTLFQKGVMGDEEDFFEWKALVEGILVKRVCGEVLL